MVSWVLKLNCFQINALKKVTPELLMEFYENSFFGVDKIKLSIEVS